MNEQFSRRQFLEHAGLITLAAALPSTRLFSHSDILNTPLVCLKRSRLSMGSIADITVYGKTRTQCIEAINAAFAEFDRIEKLMSVFDTSSQLSQLNFHAREREIEVDPSIIEVLEHAQRYHSITQGAFDVTIEPLMRLYGFHDDSSVHRFPSDKHIADVLEGVGMSNITINPVIRGKLSTVALTHPKTKLDFGGIAVGYAIDRAVTILKSYDIESALINHSGDIFAVGSPPEENAWEIGISDPQNSDVSITTVHIKDQALSTSGNYRKFVEANGKTIGHILNPHTGTPVSTILSGTVVASRAIEADALSTGLFVLGVEKAREILKRSKNLQFIAIVQKSDCEEIIKLRSE